MSDTDQVHSITTGELGRAVALIRTDIRDLKNELDDKPTARDFAYLENEIRDLKEFRQWVYRLGIPGMFAAALALLTNISTRLNQLGVG